MSTTYVPNPKAIERLRSEKNRVEELGASCGRQWAENQADGAQLLTFLCEADNFRAPRFTNTFNEWWEVSIHGMSFTIKLHDVDPADGRSVPFKVGFRNGACEIGAAAFPESVSDCCNDLEDVARKVAGLGS